MRVLLISNSSGGMYAFRREVVKAICEKADTYLCVPDDTNRDYWESIGCVFIKYEFQRHGTNPLRELAQIRYYKSLVAKIKPDVCLSYTIKPNIYGGIACAAKKVPYIANVTGLGDAIENGGIMQAVTTKLYKLGLRKAACVFFQNEANMQLFLERRIVSGKTRKIPGSGVNMQTHCYEPYPTLDGLFRFLFVARIKRDKGIEELLRAISIIRADYPNCIIDVVGSCEGDYLSKLKESEEKADIIYHGPQNDVHKFYKSSHCVVLPSYHEGTSNVLLEAAATGRPVVATNVPGCRETFDEGQSGIGCNPKDVDSLVAAMKAILMKSNAELSSMGKKGRAKMEKEYDRKIVVDAYLQEIDGALVR